MPATCMAAVLHTGAGDFSVEPVTIDAPGGHEVLVRTAATGLRHSDFHFIEGSGPVPTPCVLDRRVPVSRGEVSRTATGNAPA